MMDFKKILENHKKWMTGDGGERADLRGADLQGADLQGADLWEANLREANLRGADLRRADLRETNLRGADLRGADLQGADLRRADLREADLDFSCWPLWCGSKGVKVDQKVAAQLALHFLWLDCDDSLVKEMQEKIRPLAEKSHRFGEC